jgi:hypothetical protein
MVKPYALGPTYLIVTSGALSRLCLVKGQRTLARLVRFPAVRISMRNRFLQNVRYERDRRRHPIPGDRQSAAPEPLASPDDDRLAECAVLAHRPATTPAEAAPPNRWITAQLPVRVTGPDAEGYHLTING